MYSCNFPKLDKWKYTNLETTVLYKALCVTPVPEIVVVIITRFSGKNSSSFLSVHDKTCVLFVHEYIHSGRNTTGKFRVKNTNLTLNLKKKQEV